MSQIVGVYLAVGWGVLEFTDWLVNRYVLSPHLTDFGLVAWAAMIPTVLVLAYFHGAPGTDRWTRAEKIGIPINLALAAALRAGILSPDTLRARKMLDASETETSGLMSRGARSLTRLVHVLRRRERRYGGCSMCSDLAQGISTIVEREA